jgi:hypothetical protein
MTQLFIENNIEQEELLTDYEVCEGENAGKFYLNINTGSVYTVVSADDVTFLLKLGAKNGPVNYSGVDFIREFKLIKILRVIVEE